MFDFIYHDARDGLAGVARVRACDPVRGDLARDTVDQNTSENSGRTAAGNARILDALIPRSGQSRILDALFLHFGRRIVRPQKFASI